MFPLDFPSIARFNNGKRKHKKREKKEQKSVFQTDFLNYYFDGYNPFDCFQSY